MRHLGRIALAYLMAAIVSGFGVTSSRAVLYFAYGASEGYPPLHDLTIFVPITLLSTALIAFSALIPALVAVLLSEYSMLTSRTYYVFSGITLGVVLGFIFGRSSWAIVGLLLGALAGWVYWRIAGRHAGAWKRVES